MGEMLDEEVDVRGGFDRNDKKREEITVRTVRVIMYLLNVK